MIFQGVLDNKNKTFEIDSLIFPFTGLPLEKSCSISLFFTEFPQEVKPQTELLIECLSHVRDLRIYRPEISPDRPVNCIQMREGLINRIILKINLVTSFHNINFVDLKGVQASVQELGNRLFYNYLPSDLPRAVPHEAEILF